MQAILTSGWYPLPTALRWPRTSSLQARSYSFSTSGSLIQKGEFPVMFMFAALDTEPQFALEGTPLLIL